jgi:hypothetical protein
MDRETRNEHEPTPPESTSRDPAARQAEIEAKAARIGGILGRLARRVAANARPEAERAAQRARAAAEAARPHVEDAGRRAVEFARAHDQELLRAAELSARVAADRIVPPAVRPIVDAAELGLRRDQHAARQPAAADEGEPASEQGEGPPPTERGI